MPAPTSNAAVTRDGEALRFAGPLLRAQVAAGWRQALPLLAGVRRFDLTAVERVDSAGMALLAELAARVGAPVTIAGTPAGYEALCAAYRLTPALAFAR
ncbi:MAG TPA: STAS domain-containing protein [Xanthomonadaceae bacterium]|nr:STAS domain-containing protein [Xanthomonadaceae bacterium]